MGDVRDRCRRVQGSWRGSTSRGSLLDFPVPGSLLGTSHKYRIDWKTTSVDFYVDDALVHTETATVTRADAGRHQRPRRRWPRALRGLDPRHAIRRKRQLHIARIRRRRFDNVGTDVVDGGPALRHQPPDVRAPGEHALARRLLDGVHRGSLERNVDGGSSRYIQYRADLATTITSATPVLQDVHVSCDAVPDVTPPTISSVTATPGGGATAVIGWNTDELANSRVDYGTSPGSLTLSASSASLVGTHTITLTGLTATTTYYYRVSSVDAASNSATQPILADPPLSFVSLATPLITNVVATSAGDGLSASVTWSTDVPATSRVDYGTSAGSLTLNVSSGALVTSHGLTLPGLTPATRTTIASRRSMRSRTARPFRSRRRRRTSPHRLLPARSISRARISQAARPAADVHLRDLRGRGDPPARRGSRVLRRGAARRLDVRHVGGRRDGIGGERPARGGRSACVHDRELRPGPIPGVRCDLPVGQLPECRLRGGRGLQRPLGHHRHRRDDRRGLRAADRRRGMSCSPRARWGRRTATASTGTPAASASPWTAARSRRSPRP